MIDGPMLVNLLIQLFIVGGICWLLWWLVGYFALPAPFDKVARCIIALVAVVFLINILLSLNGHPLVTWGGAYHWPN